MERNIGAGANIFQSTFKKKIVRKNSKISKKSISKIVWASIYDSYECKPVKKQEKTTKDVRMYVNTLKIKKKRTEKDEKKQLKQNTARVSRNYRENLIDTK